MDKEQKQVIERLENIVYLYNRESRGWHDCNDIRLNSNDIKAIKKAIELVKAIPSAEPKEEQWKDFALWVAKEIFVYEWEYNKDAFAEIACRKLAKLGIVRAKGDEWELVEPQESEG